MGNSTKLLVSAILAVGQAAYNFQTNAAASAQVPSQAVDNSSYTIQLNATSVDPLVVKTAPTPDFDRDVLTPLHQVQAQEAAAAAAARAKAAALAKRAKTASLVSTRPVLTYSGDHNAWMATAGISPSDYGYVDFISNHEGSWQPCKVYGGAINCSYSGSAPYGMFQAKPGIKMAAFGSDWATNPITQLRWAQAYAVGSYGSWYNAYIHWLNHHWW